MSTEILALIFLNTTNVIPSGTTGKGFTCHARDTRDMGSICGSGRYPQEGNSTPLQYS